MTHIRPHGGDAEELPGGTQRQAVQRRREVMDNLRRLAAQLDAASALERRAGATGNAALAAVLRERAAERLRIADVVREHLAESQSPVPPPRDGAPRVVPCDTQPIPVVDHD